MLLHLNTQRGSLRNVEYVPKIRRLHATTLYPSNVHWYSLNKITKAFRMLPGPNFHWRDCKSLLAVKFLNQMNTVHMFRPCLFYFNLNARWVQVFPTVTVKILVFRRVTPCSLESTKNFERNYFLHILGILPLKDDAVVFPNLQPITTRLQDIVVQNIAVFTLLLSSHLQIRPTGDPFLSDLFKFSTLIPEWIRAVSPAQIIVEQQ